MSNNVLENISQPQAIVIGVIGLLAVPTLIVGVLEITGITTFSLITASITGDLPGSQLCVSGASDINLDQSTTNLPSGEAWRIDVTAGQCNEYIIGGGAEIDQDEIEDRDFEGKSDFQAGITDLETYIEIGIQEDPLDRTVTHPVDIYGNDIKVFECDEAWRSSCVEDDWENVRQWQDGGDDVFYLTSRDASSSSAITGNAAEYAGTGYFDASRIPLYGNDVIVASKPVFKGDVHEFEADQMHGFNAEIVLCADGDCQPADISHESRSESMQIDETVGFGTQQAEVTWQGSLMGDVFGLDTSKYLPAQEDGGSMNLANRELINEWERNAEDIDLCLDRLDSPDDADFRCDVDGYANNAFADATAGLEDDIGGIDANVDIDSRSLQIKPTDHSTAFSRPSFIFDVNAEWIGVAANEPEPRILNTQDFDLEQNMDRDKNVEITNEGADAHINLDATCDGQLSATSDTKHVAEGQTETFTINVNAGTMDAREYTCTLEASSTAAGQGTTDTANFRATVLEDHETINGNGDNGNGDTVTPPPPPPQPPLWQYVLLGATAAALIGGVLYLLRDRIRKVIN